MQKKCQVLRPQHFDSDCSKPLPMHADKFIMPRCTVHRRHTVVRSCVGLSVPRFLGMPDFAYLRER